MDEIVHGSYDLLDFDNHRAVTKESAGSLYCCCGLKRSVPGMETRRASQITLQIERK